MAVDLSDFKLTEKQKLWVLAYCSNGFNGTAASRSAQYRGSDNTLAVVGSENLRKPNIRDALEAMYREMRMSTDEILTRLAGMSRGVIPTRITKNEKQGDTTTYDAGRAIAVLAPTKLELTGKDGGPIDIIDSASAARDALLGRLLQDAPEENEADASRGDVR